METNEKKRAIIELQDVWKIYRMGDVEVPALQGLTLTIYPHEFVAIMGPSGSGKSTAMNMVGCLDVPTQGKVNLDGEDISRLAESDLAQIRGRKIGFIFQMFNLVPSLTVLENVTLPALIYESTPEEAEAKAMKTLEYIGMEERLEHYPNQLSGGQRQRVAIARALINDPEIIFADEPTGNLDTKTGRDVLEMFHEMHGQGKTIIIVTHDVGITKMTHRTIRIVDGKIVQS